MTAVPKRENVRRLLERVPDEDLPTVEKMLQGVVREEARPQRREWSAVLAAFDSAPEDDEGELSDELVARLAESRRAAAEGRVFTDEEVRERLGL